MHQTKTRIFYVLDTLNFVNCTYMVKNQTLADLIRVIKFKSGITQSDIAAKIGVSKQYLSDTINGRYPFSDDLKQKLYEQFTYLQNGDGNSVNSSQTIGDITGSDVSNVNVNGDDNNAQGSYSALLKIVETYQASTIKFQEQIDRLLSIIEKQYESVSR